MSDHNDRTSPIATGDHSPLTLDDIEDLLPPVEPQDDESSSFLDLEALLEEAVSVAEARKTARKQGTRTDPAIAAIVREADVEMTWEPQSAVARFIETHCACGASHRRFDGWFIASTHRRDPYARRFARADDHCGLPAWQYVTEEAATECAECLTEVALPLATLDLLTGIDALGTPAFCCLAQTDQIAFYLGQASDDADDAEDAAMDAGDTDLEAYDAA